jgi:hypothetical protein
MSLRDEVILVLRHAGETDVTDATLERHFDPRELPSTFAQVRRLRDAGKIRAEDLA